VVITRTLDSVIEELGIAHMKIVKIDVEGAEGKVLSGAKRVVERYSPFFIIDLHTPEQDVFVAHLLTSWGYTLSRLSGPAILRTDTGWRDPVGVWGTIVAAPPL
jgi:Methyltransferase FkbM domain